MSSVKGSTFIPRLKYIRDHDSGGVWDRVMGRLDKRLVEVIDRGILLNQWYPLPDYLNLSRAIDQVLGHGDLKLLWELGRVSAEEALHGIYKIFYKVGSPEFIIKMASTVWRQYYDSGKLEVVTEKAERGKRIRLIVLEMEPSQELWLSVGGWVQRTLELSGGKNVQVVIASDRLKTHASCEYIATWE